MNEFIGDGSNSIVFWQMVVKLLLPLLSFCMLLACYYITSARKNTKALDDISNFLKDGFKTEMTSIKERLDNLNSIQSSISTDISILKDRYPRSSLRINTSEDDDDDDIVNMGEYLPTKKEFIEAQRAIKTRKKRKIDDL